jgi:mono/diheme cytochrome c family protein
MLRKLIFTAALTVFAALIATSATAGDAAAGKTLYDTNCMSCHGMTGKGDGPVGAVLTPRPRDFSAGEFKFDTDTDGTPGSDADLQAVIKQGAGAFGGSPLMAPWPSLSDDEIANLIAYIRSLKE